MLQTVRATEHDIRECQRWLARRGVADVSSDLFSSTGYVVPGVAGLWLYLTDSSIAYMEMLVGNPDISKELRRAGLDAVIERTIAEARAAGTRMLLGPVQNPVVEARLCKHGFSVAGRGLALLSMAFTPDNPSPHGSAVADQAVL